MTAPGGVDTLPALLAGLVAAAHEAPDRPALVPPDGRVLTFAALLDRVTHATAGLAAHGIEPGMRTVLLVPPGPDFVVAAFALLARGAVPVLIDPGIGVRRVGAALREVAPRAFVGSGRAHLARRVLRWAPTARRLVVTGGPPAPHLVGGFGAVRLSQLERHAEPSGRPAAWTPRPGTDEAVLLFTSGATGPPKAVVHRHPHLAATVATLRTVYDLRPGEVTVATFAPFALFGPALGQTTVLPDMDFTRPAAADPDHLRELIAMHRADLLFASPALLAALAGHGRRLPSLRLVLSSGAPVPAHVVDAITALLPAGAVVTTPYGMTEALPVCVIDGEELRATAAAHQPPRGVCVGTPVPGTDVLVIDVDDRPSATVTDDDGVADGRVGELVVRGPQVTEAYAGRPLATARAKTTWDGRTAHRTGDLAWRDGDGRLWICGRTFHRVVTATGPIDPLPMEQLVLDHPHVLRAALVGVTRAGTTRPVLVVQPTADPPTAWRPGAREARARLVTELRARLDAHPHGAAVERILLRRRIPVDARHNAKIGYEQLARWATARLHGRIAWVGSRAFGGGPG
jgi:acyl-CoA synthetase (AMP-forming)/AMP-acid ligase II